MDAIPLFGCIFLRPAICEFISCELARKLISSQVSKLGVLDTAWTRAKQNKQIKVVKKLPHKIFQPNCDYRTQNVQGKFRSFKESCYSDFPWLEYKAIKDSVFCYSCRYFCQQKSGRVEVCFTT
uniref:TTF-type domain-containing protein n=1 Tax=Timema bartmani TaxID=61472 RepID=A0A7R9I2W2_9NEOP|nr:unnamed protein product [Timema bartmani]